MYQPFNIFILSFGGLQGILLGMLLLRQKAHRAGYMFLLLYLLTLLLQIAMKVASKIWLIQNLPGLYFPAYELPFLYGPFWWLFVLKMTNPARTLRLKDGLHFLPFVLVLVAEPLARRWEIPMFFLSRQILLVLQVSSLAVYHLYCFRMLQNRQGHSEKIPLLQQLSAGSFVVTVLIAVGLFVMYRYHPRLMELRYLFAVATLFIYLVSYQVMRRPDWFALPKPGAVAGLSFNNHPAEKKYHHSTLKDTDMDAILIRLDDVMQNRQPFLEPELSIDALATLADTNRHDLSRVINERLQQNFFDYLNAHRVKTARRLLADPDRNHLKIAAIAYDSGFNSLSTFNEVFKKQSGQTPSEFRRLAQNGYREPQV